jgi:hypothetical protein
MLVGLALNAFAYFDPLNSTDLDDKAVCRAAARVLGIALKIGWKRYGGSKRVGGISY